jgi:hypothetical protein
MTALAKANSNCKRRSILSSERKLHKDYNRKCSVEKEILAVGLKGLDAITN